MDSDRIKNALDFISSDDRDIWIKIGMAIKSAMGDAGHSIWDDWSRQSTSYSEASAKAVWKSIRSTGKVTEATLIYEARNAGWRDDRQYHQPTQEEIDERRRIAQKRFTEEEKQLAKDRAIAAQKAAGILQSCELDIHAYMDRKGMPDAVVNVWRRTGKDPIMVVPMYYRSDLCGVQLISIYGSKMFLKNQRCSEAFFQIGNGKHIFIVEGVATGMTAHEVLNTLKISHTIIVAFSAGNMVKIANVYRDAFILADNDESETGEKVAIASGCRYWIPPDVDQDLNDFRMEHGLFKTSQVLKKVLVNLK